MDRGRRASLTGSSDARRRGKPLPPVSERSGPYGQMVEPEAVKFGGSMIAADVQEDKDSLVIDPNLLVGPLYVSDTAGKTGRIKDQITDITDKLHRTLHTFDEFDDFEHEDPLVNMMRKRIGEVDDQNMQFQLNSVMNQYEDMAAQLTDANRERDEMLFQLADWFTTDHIDLEDIKTSIDDSEEDNIKQSYFETVTNFEKLKKLQQKITDASTKGKPTRQLNAKKVELEKDVVDKFKIMKDMSMQTMKLKISDDAPWKHAANEIVSMLKNVRGENAEELAAITKNMKEMIEQLEKQAMTIKSLTAELREKKEVVKHLTDENGDLNQDVMVLRARYIRYEKELDAAKTMIRKLHKQQLVDGEITELPPEDIGKSLTESISKVLNRVDDRPGGLKRLGSDPAMLRTQIREIQDDLDCIRSEYAKKAEEMDELNTELLEKKEYIRSIEEENEKFSKELKKLRQQRRQSIAAGVVPPAEGESHQCEHCKCHVPEKDIDEEIEELKKEVQKWQDKCNYFKKCLADTEMKLSQAYKDISDLRMERESFPSDEPAEKPKEKKKEEKPKETTKEESKPKDDVEPKKEPKERKEPKEKKPPKPKQEVKPKYLEQSKRTERKLPPIDKMQPEPLDETVPLTDKQYRELNLYKVGDLQGKLNMLANEIMDFVTEVGKMLFTEKDETKKVQAVTAFSFGQDGNQGKKAKETIDPKEQEAKQKKSQVIFNGQHAVSKLREAFDMLSNSLGLQHTEYEMIYRSFKISQQRQAIRREIMIGRLPVTALRDFDIKMGQENKEIAEHAMLSSYYNISYGGTGGPSISNKPRNMLHRKTSSISSIRSESPFGITDIAEGGRRRSNSGVNRPDLANTELVAQPPSTDLWEMLQTPKNPPNTIAAKQAREKASSAEIEPRVFSHIRKSLKERGVPKAARDLILKSWRTSTKKQYNTYLTKWFNFCSTKINPIQPNINNILKFLSNLYDNGLQYRSLGTARSAISVLLKICSDIDINKHEELTRFMRGVFLERPALPRYNVTWPVDTVLKYLQTAPISTLFQLSCKLCMLFLLLSAQRCQTLHLIELSDIKMTKDSVSIAPRHILKHTKPGKHLDLITFKAYKKDKTLCIVKTISDYLERTKNLRNDEKLLISTIKPHKAATKSTVSRWIKFVMGKAGIDTAFKPHSTRAAATSKAKLSGVPIETIIKTAGWSSTSVFAKFYDKPVTKEKTVQEAILHS